MRSQGSSFRNRCMVSNVAPPQTSMAQKPTWSIISATGSMSAVRPRVANSDWWPSRSERSSILTAFFALGRLAA